MIKKPKLVNAQAMAENHPDTFEVPAPAALNALTVGSVAKVTPDTSPGERFWVEITEHNGNDFVGRIDNDLVLTVLHGLSRGDFIEFKSENVYSIEAPKRTMYHGAHKKPVTRALS
jgi:hypothetical protein